MPLDTELHKAAHKGDFSSVRDFVESGEFDVNEQGAQDRTAIHRAAGANHVDIIQYLLQSGAPVDCVDRCRRTPLHWAVISGHLDATQLLLENGADLRCATMSGMNPLMCAVQQGWSTIVDAILDWAAPAANIEEGCGGDLPTVAALCAATDAEGKTALMFAKERGDKQTVKLLKSYEPRHHRRICCGGCGGCGGCGDKSKSQVSASAVVPPITTQPSSRAPGSVAADTTQSGRQPQTERGGEKETSGVVERRAVGCCFSFRCCCCWRCCWRGSPPSSERGVSPSSREASQNTQSSKPPAGNRTAGDASSTATETRGGHETGQGSSRGGSEDHEPCGGTDINITFAHDGGGSSGGGGGGGGNSVSRANSEGVQGHVGQQGRPGESTGAACSCVGASSSDAVAEAYGRQSQLELCVTDAETGGYKGRFRTEDVLLLTVVHVGKVNARSGEASGRSRSGKINHLHDHSGHRAASGRAGKGGGGGGDGARKPRRRRPAAGGEAHQTSSGDRATLSDTRAKKSKGSGGDAVTMRGGGRQKERRQGQGDRATGGGGGGTCSSQHDIASSDYWRLTRSMKNVGAFDGEEEDIQEIDTDVTVAVKTTTAMLASSARESEFLHGVKEVGVTGGRVRGGGAYGGRPAKSMQAPIYSSLHAGVVTSASMLSFPAGPLVSSAALRYEDVGAKYETGVVKVQKGTDIGGLAGYSASAMPTAL